MVKLSLVAFAMIAPKGCNTIAQGSALSSELIAKQALKGRYKERVILYYALSGLDGFVLSPRALPWAMLFSPFRACRNKGLVVIIGF
ncbi:MAG: hypothetical protein HW390_2869 [Candidatus Brocadiaceae bacterium]|nr:hypothetical protein [Candidatus Brocadiaceae bacterium]